MCELILQKKSGFHSAKLNFVEKEHISGAHVALKNFSLMHKMQFLLSARVVFLLYGLTVVSGLHLDDGAIEELAQEFLDLPETKGAELTKSLNRNADRNTKATLRYVSMVTRHGHRSPTATYPTDPYPFTDLRYWPDGPGQLTRLGKQQMFRVGRILRRRYDGFLNTNFFPNDTAVRSNPFDRDFMSAACVLAGLYPPVGYQIWHRKIAWQPIPIWEDRYDVAEIASTPDVCPRFTEEMHKSFHELEKDYPKYKTLLEYLSEHTGQRINRVSRIPLFWDIFVLQSEQGLPLPAWVNKVYPKKMVEIEGKAFRAYVGGTQHQIRLISGPILEMVLDQLNEKSRGAMRPNRKLHILAAHDITLRAVLSGLGIHDAFPIETSAFMVFELHENTQGHNVQVLYFNSSTTRKPFTLEMPSCRNPCSLINFNKMLEPVIPRNWREECGNVTTATDDDPELKFNS